MTHSPTLQERHFRRKVSDFLAIELEQAPGRPLRLSLVAVGIVIMLWYDASPYVAVVGPLYLLSDLTYSRHVHRVLRALEVTPKMLRRLVAHHSCTVLAFCMLAIVNAFWPSDAGAYSAVLLIFGQALNCIAHDTRSMIASRLGAVVVTLGAQIAVFGIGAMGDFQASDRIFLHAAAALISIYFGNVVLATAKTRMRLSARTEELVHAQKGEAVGRLTSGIAHDFNNLLTVLRGNIDLLAEVPEKERGPLMAEVGAAIDRGGRLVSQLLAVGRRGPADAQEIELPVFLANFATFARRALPANVTLDVRAEDGLRLVTDGSQLEAALLNLVVNARDAIEGVGRIEVVASRIETPRDADDEAGQWLCIAVQDSGTGMSPAVLERATEAFVTTKEVGSGSGLGLAMVRDFVERSGGRLDLQSKPGEGTTARLELPC